MAFLSFCKRGNKSKNRKVTPGFFELMSKDIPSSLIISGK
jgi:hypothetical protein